MRLNINTDAVVKYTNTLEKMHRSALPNAVRGALNKAAFDVKQNTMLKSAKNKFVSRQPNFFRANSRVEMAKGWEVGSMKAVVGFTEQGLQGANNFSVRDLEQQEYGGIIKRRSFIPTDQARGGSGTKAVRPGNRLSGIKNIINSNTIDGANNKQKFLHAIAKAGVGGYVIGNKAKKILWRIESISGRVVKLKALYSFQENRSVNVSGTGFMRSASLESGDKIEDFYIAEAERQIKKLIK